MKFVYLSAAVILGVIAFLSVSGAVAQSDCIEPISADGDYTGSWDSDCLSENTPTEPTNPPAGTRYARFYTLTLTASADVTIDLTSTTDTYMYLMQGTGTGGTVLRENDDDESGNTNSRIQASLQPGGYTIEATTYELQTTGNFSLTISGIPSTAPTITPTVVPMNATPTQGPSTPRADANPTTCPCPNYYACT